MFGYNDKMPGARLLHLTMGPDQISPNSYKNKHVYITIEINQKLFKKNGFKVSNHYQFSENEKSSGTMGSIKKNGPFSVCK